jgi:hypothetical protein
LAGQAEERRQAATAEAEAILTRPSLDDVALAYQRAEDGIARLVEMTVARQTAVVNAARALRDGGALPAGVSPSRPMLSLPSGRHLFSDTDAGPVVAELWLTAAERHRLVTSGGTMLATLLARGVSRSDRGRVSTRATELRNSESRAE